MKVDHQPQDVVKGFQEEHTYVMEVILINTTNIHYCMRSLAESRLSHVNVPLILPTQKLDPPLGLWLIYLN